MNILDHFICYKCNCIITEGDKKGQCHGCDTIFCDDCYDDLTKKDLKMYITCEKYMDLHSKKKMCLLKKCDEKCGGIKKCSWKDCCHTENGKCSGMINCYSCEPHNEKYKVKRCLKNLLRMPFKGKSFNLQLKKLNELCAEKKSK